MMKYIPALITIAFCLLLSTCFGRAHVINELMPDPDDACRDCTEWVELFIDNVSESENFVMDAGGVNNSFSANESGYIVVTENRSAFSFLWGSNETTVLVGEMSLNNDGDCVLLYSNASVIDSFCYNHSRRNVSWARCENGWSACDKATPGYENACHDGSGNGSASNGSVVSIMRWRTAPAIPSVNETLNFSVEIGYNSSARINVSVFIMVEELGLTISCGGFESSNSTLATINCSWIVPESVEENGCRFEAYPVIEYDGSVIAGIPRIIAVGCVVDYGDPFIEAFNPAGSTRFGDFALVKSLLYTGSLDFPVRIVTYIYRPKWASVDLEGMTIRTHLNDTNTALLLDDIKMGENITLFLPLLVKLSCGGEYTPGVYQGRVRIYRDGSDDIVVQDTFNISLNGNNGLFCPAECPKCEQQCSCGSCPASCSCQIPPTVKNDEKEVKERKIIEFVSFQENPTAGEVFKTAVRIDNFLNVTGNFSIYSYVFEGSRCVSLGFDGKSWKNVWHANRQNINVAAGSSLNVTLENMIENDTVPGDYKLRVRLIFDDKSRDITESVHVSPAKRISPRPPVPGMNETGLDETVRPVPEPGIPVTGTVPAKKHDPGSFFPAVLNDIAVWILSLFKFY
jgi:hypothetical protein